MATRESIATRSVRTPRTFTIPLAAGTEYVLPQVGRVATILSLSGAVSVQAAFDNETWTPFFQRIGYPDEAEFSQVRFWNNGAVAITIVVTISDVPILDSRSDALAASGLLVEIPKTLVAATGGAATLLFAANPNRKLVSITASEDNGGFIYVGSTAATAAAAHFKVLLPSGEWYDEFYRGPVYAVGNDAVQHVVGYEE